MESFYFQAIYILPRYSQVPHCTKEHPCVSY